MLFGGVAGHLVTIADAQENHLVRRFGGEGNKWIGLTDSTAVSTIDGWNPRDELGTSERGGTWWRPYPPPGETPDEPTQRGSGFKWLDHSPLLYQNWANGEPNDAGVLGEDAVQIGADGLWNDHSAAETLGQSDHYLPFVVEFDTILDQYKFHVLERKSLMPIADLGAAKSLLALPPSAPEILSEAKGRYFAVSFADPEASDPNSDYVTVPFLTDTKADDNFFATSVTGLVDIPTRGEWTFALTHGDLVELTVGGKSVAPASPYGTRLYVFELEAGITEVELVFLEPWGPPTCNCSRRKIAMSSSTPYSSDWLVTHWAEVSVWSLSRPRSSCPLRVLSAFSHSSCEDGSRTGARRRKKRPGPPAGAV